MKIHSFLYLISVVLVLNTTVFAAPTPEGKKAEATWKALLASLDSGKPFDARIYDGAHICFRGILVDVPSRVSGRIMLSEEKVRPVVIHLDFPRYDQAKKRFILRRVICHVTLREEEIKAVADYPASLIEVAVYGKITRLDAATQIIEVQSESAFVFAAN